MSNQPKPTTPLTDAEVASAYKQDRVQLVSQKFARSLEPKLQEAERELAEANDRCESDWLRLITKYNDERVAKQEAERERDEAIVARQIAETSWRDMANQKNNISAERDQLIKVVDELSEQPTAKTRKDKERLIAACEELMAYQNGSPLVTWEKGWSNAMEMCRTAITDAMKKGTQDK